MPPFALGLVLIAATLHAVWNLLAKQSRGDPAFFWLALTASSVLYLPAFVVAVIQNPIPALGWVWIIATGALHAAYFWSLAAAYRQSDFSVAYPLARGLGPTLVLIVSVAILGEPISPVGLAGVLLVVIGIFTVNLRGFRPRDWLEAPLLLLKPSGRYATLTGVLVATYTLVDKQGVSIVNPVVYVYLMFVLSAVGITPFVLGKRGLRRWHPDSIRLRDVGVVAILWVATYLLVLIALTQAPTAYVSAAREASIVIGAALGILVLHEPRRAPRLVGVAAIATGVILVAVA